MSLTRPGCKPDSALPVQPEVVELSRRSVALLVPVGHQSDPDVRPGRQGPDPALDPVPAIPAAPGAELVLTVARVDPVRDAQPGRLRGRTDDRAAVRQPPGVGHLLAELGLPGVPDR